MQEPFPAAPRSAYPAAMPDHSPDYIAGWEAALEAAHHWHLAQAKQAKVLSTRTRFPKNLEREAEVHERAAGLVTTLSPDDV